MKRAKYNGSLIYGPTDVGDHWAWHIADNPVAGGDFTACGVAHEQLVICAETEGREEGIANKDGGLCTCEECLRQLAEWQNVIAKCPAIAKAK